MPVPIEQRQTNLHASRNFGCLLAALIGLTAVVLVALCIILVLSYAGQQVLEAL